MDGSEILIEAGQTASAGDGKGSLYEFEKKKKPKIKITPQGIVFENEADDQADHSRLEDTSLMRGLLPDSDLPSPRFGNVGDLQDE